MYIWIAGADQERSRKEGNKQKKTLPPLPLTNLFFILSISKKKKRGKKIIFCPFRKQIYVTYARKKKKGVLGAFLYFEHNTNSKYSILRS